jgi:hypothetical protein
MSRRDREQAAQQAASEAGRILQAQRKQEPSPAPQDAPAVDPPAPKPADQNFEDAPLPKPRNEAREKALEEMWARDAERKGIVEDAPAPAPEPAPVAKDPEPPTPEQMLEGGKFSEGTAVTGGSTAVVDDSSSAPETIEYVRVKVDGEEFDAPKSEVEEAGGIKAYQRDKAAERRLAKANETLAEAKRMQASMQAQMQAAAKPAEAEVTYEEFIQSRVEDILYGGPVKSARALAEIIQRNAQPKIDQNAIINDAMTRINYMSAVRQFNSEFNDLTQDPDLMTVIQAKASAGISAMPADRSAVDWAEFFRRIGNEVRIKFNRPSQPATGTAASTTTTGQTSQVSREARKASIVNLPTAAVRAEAPKDPKPETRADVLESMRKARGFQSG